MALKNSHMRKQRRRTDALKRFSVKHKDERYLESKLVELSSLRVRLNIGIPTTFKSLHDYMVSPRGTMTGRWSHGG